MRMDIIVIKYFVKIEYVSLKHMITDITTEAVIEARETNRNKNIIIIQTSNPINTGSGAIQNSIPALVATPLQPRNLK